MLSFLLSGRYYIQWFYSKHLEHFSLGLLTLEFCFSPEFFNYNFNFLNGYSVCPLCISWVSLFVGPEKVSRLIWAVTLRHRVVPGIPLSLRWLTVWGGALSSSTLMTNVLSLSSLLISLNVYYFCWSSQRSNFFVSLIFCIMFLLFNFLISLLLTAFIIFYFLGWHFALLVWGHSSFLCHGISYFFIHLER